MKKNYKIMLIIAGVLAAGVGAYFLAKKIKQKKQMGTGSSNNGSGGSGGTTATGKDKFGWQIMERAPGAPGKNIPTRANNPMDIRSSTVDWNGQIGSTSNGGFCVFDTLQNGIRAAMKNLRTYETKYNLHTLREKMLKWAPVNENRSTLADEVARIANVNPDQNFEVTDVNQCLKIIPAWAKIEGFEGTIPENTIRAAHKSAFGN